MSSDSKDLSLEVKRGIPKTGENCPVCQETIESVDAVLCCDCGQRHHFDCWLRNEGCGQKYCSGWRSHVACKSPQGDRDRRPWYYLEGDGSCEVVSTCWDIQFWLLFIAFIGLLAHIPPFFYWSWVWIEPIAHFLLLAPIIPFFIVRFGLRRHIIVRTASGSVDYLVTLFGLKLKSTRGYAFADESVEVHLRSTNATEDEMVRLRCQRSRNAAGKQKRVNYRLSVLDAECEERHLFTRASRIEDDVVKLAERIAATLDCPIRRMDSREKMTQQNLRIIVGKWQEQK